MILIEQDVRVTWAVISSPCTRVNNRNTRVALVINSTPASSRFATFLGPQMRIYSVSSLLRPTTWWLVPARLYLSSGAW